MIDDGILNRDVPDVEGQLRARIAELEAERHNAWRQFRARMDEVMAERDRLKAENAELEAERDEWEKAAAAWKEAWGARLVAELEVTGNRRSLDG